MNKEADFKMRAARFAAATNYPYLSSALYAMQIVPTEGIGTMGVSKGWRCFYDPQTVLKWKTPEVSIVIVHEVWHLLRDHITRATDSGVKDESHGTWNEAADCEINDDLTGLPGDPCLPKKYNLKDNETAEYYFAELMKQKKESPKGGKDKGEGDNGQGQPYGGSCADGKQRPWEDGDGLGKDEGKDGEAPAPKVSKIEAELIRRDIAKKIQDAVKGCGKIPEGMKRWADAVMTVRVRWEKELASTIRRAAAVKSGCQDYSWNRPHRRNGAYGEFILPSLIKPLLKVGVVVDTSGSMSDLQIGVSMKQVGYILQSAGLPIDVATCDTHATISKNVLNPSTVKIVGGGGTDMGAGLEAIGKCKPDVVICLTDGLTPWPKQGFKFRTIVCMVGTNEKGPEWAKTIYVPQGEEAAA